MCVWVCGAHPAWSACVLRVPLCQRDPGIVVVIAIGRENHGTQCGFIMIVVIFVVIIILTEMQALF